MKRDRRRHVLATAGRLGVLSAALFSAVIRADPQDPSIPRRYVVGAPRGACPTVRVDSAHTGRTRSSLPRDPAVTRRISLGVGLSHGVVVDEQGRIVATTLDSRVSQFDSNGRRQWSVELGSAAAGAPVLTSDGTRVTVTDRGDVMGITPGGRTRFTIRLPGGLVRAAPLAGDDGTILVAAGPRVFRLDADGDVLFDDDASEPVRSLVADRDTVYVGTESGDVLEWKEGRKLRAVGDLGGHPTSELVVRAPGTLVAIVQNGSLVELDTRDGTRGQLASIGPDAFAGAPAITTEGDVVAATGSGLLLGYRGGQEAFRFSLGRPTTPSDVSTPVVDPGGTVAFALGPSLGVALPSHDVRTALIAGCGAPLAVVPWGRGAFAVACSSGVLAIAENRGPGSPAP